MLLMSENMSPIPKKSVWTVAMMPLRRPALLGAGASCAPSTGSGPDVAATIAQEGSGADIDMTDLPDNMTNEKSHNF